MNANQTWDKIAEWFSRNGIPIGASGAAGAYVATEFDLDASHVDYCDCGKSEERRQVVGSFSVAIEGLGDSTQVTIAATYRASFVSQSATTSTWTCISTGGPERSLLNFIGTP